LARPLFQSSRLKAFISVRLQRYVLFEYWFAKETKMIQAKTLKSAEIVDGGFVKHPLKPRGLQSPF